MGPRGGQNGEKSEKKHRPNKKGGGAPQRRPILEENGANMVPTWAPRWSPNRTKIDAKINEKIDASWNRFLNGCWWILGGKMEASWHPHGIKNVHNFERRFFGKSCSRYSGGSIFEILGVKVESKNRTKMDQKIACNMTCILASIFDRF